MKEKKVKIALFLISLFIFFTRFYNLDSSGTFFWDPAQDLVKIHQYFIEKEVTLIGPISEEGDKVFSSLTYYMLMPFAVLGNFDPLSITLGAAFWGFLTALLVLFLTKLINPKLILFAAVLSVVWFPLIETSRWAWNPNLIPFWIVLGLIFSQYKNAVSLFFSGLALGLSIHHHYLAIIAVGAFIVLASLLAIKKKSFRLQLFVIIGFFISILPFIIFDILHPPGLFLTRFLYFNQVKEKLVLIDFLIEIGKNFKSVLLYYTHQVYLAMLLGAFIVTLSIYDLRKKSTAIIYLLPWFFQVVLIAVVKNAFNHYFLPGLIFLLTWLIFPRGKIGEKISKLIIIILVSGSLFTIIPQLKTNPYVFQGWQPNTRTVREITGIMEKTITKKKLESVNVAVLGSLDPNTYGWKYRSLLLVKEIRIKSRDEYFNSDYLFVVSQSSEKEIRNDPAAEMHNFQNGSLINSWSIENSGWKLYLFKRAS